MPKASAGEISARLSIPMPTPRGYVTTRLKSADGQREAEGRHDHGERDRQQDDGEERVLHAAQYRPQEAVTGFGLGPHRDPGLAHRRLGLGDRVGAVVEDRGGEHRVGPALGDALDQVLSSPTPPEAITGTATASATARVSSRS